MIVKAGSGSPGMLGLQHDAEGGIQDEPPAQLAPAQNELLHLISEAQLYVHTQSQSSQQKLVYSITPVVL